MKLARSAILVVLLSLLWPAVARSAESTQLLAPLRLDDAVKEALDNNTAVKNSALEIGISKDRVGVARSHFFPTVRLTGLGLQLFTPLNFSFDKGVFGDFDETGPIPKERTNVSTPEKPALLLNAFVAQPILDLPRIYLSVKQAKLGKELALQKHQAQRVQIIQQVKNAYYKALELEDGLQVLSAGLKLYQETDRVTGEFLAQKTVLKADAIEAKQQLANAEFELLKLNNALLTQKEEINHLLGRDNLQSNFGLNMVAEPALLKLDLPAARAAALSGRSEIKQLRTQSQQLDLEKRIKKLEYLPHFNVMFDYFSVFGTEVVPQNLVFGGLLLDWQPLDWGKKHYEYQQTKKQLVQTRNQQRDLEAQITLEVNSAHRRVQESNKRLEVMRLGQQLAQERLRVIANKYKEQATLLKDVLAAERELTQSNNNYSQALLYTWTARADLEKALGTE